MSTTPQIIKDREFQVKFRGYDQVEVKAYLDEVAEEFFELQERCRLQVDDLQAFHEEKEGLEKQKVLLEAGSSEIRKKMDDLKRAESNTEQKLAISMKESEGLRAVVSRLEEEKKEQAEALSDAAIRIRKAEEAVAQERAGKEALESKIKLLEMQWKDARQDEVDFKSTLLAAQKFCDSMKEKSGQEAEQLIETAKVEVENLRQAAQVEIGGLRQAAHAELAHLPGEIATLQQKKIEVRRELRTTLESYLQNLEIFPAEENEQDLSSENEVLFQRIQSLEDGSFSPEDLNALKSDMNALKGYSESSAPTLEEVDLVLFFEDNEQADDQKDDEKG
jgi:DivIVA domain-containing protein